MFCELRIILVDFVRVKIAVADPVNCLSGTGLDLVPFPESVVFIAGNAFLVHMKFGLRTLIHVKN
jgi:hypothetical protein